MIRKPFIPPGGFQGFAQQSQAVQAILRGKSPTRKKRRTTKKRTAKKRVVKKRATARRRTTKQPARMVKGSAAAKRHMAKLRKMRKR